MSGTTTSEADAMASKGRSTVGGSAEAIASNARLLEARLDAALADSFPASDPPALVLPHGGARPAAVATPKRDTRRSATNQRRVATQANDEGACPEPVQRLTSP